jgi:hypothetical protein
MARQFQAQFSSDKNPTHEIMKLQTLDTLGRRIKDREEAIQLLKKQAIKDCNNAVCEALLQGQDLLEAKKLCGHGNFVEWLDTHCPELSARTAQRYMLLAANTTRVSHLEEAASIRAALALCEVEEQAERREPKRWPAFLEAIQRFDKFCGYVHRNPLSAWPAEGLDKLREQMLPIAAALWPGFGLVAAAPNPR